MANEKDLSDNSKNKEQNKKIIEGFRLRNVCGEWVVVGEGVKQVNFDKLISLNESAATLWQNVEGKEFSVEDLAKILTENYDVDQETALNDAKEVAEAWLSAGIISK